MDTVKDIHLANINVICNAGGFFRHTVDTSWAIGTHTFMQSKLYYVTKGSFDLTVNGVSYQAERGDCFFIPAGTPHSYSDQKGIPFEKYWLHLDIYPGTSYLTALPLPHRISVPRASEFHRLITRYVRYAEKNTLVDALYAKSTVTALLAEYIRLAACEGVPLPSYPRERIDEVLRYIEHNIETPLSVPALAAHFHLHPNHFIRFFKTNTGYTPARYIKMKKMALAKQYLEETDLFVSEIMEKIGIYDACSFSKQFKSVHSYSPRDYRTYFQNAKRIRTAKRK